MKRTLCVHVVGSLSNLALAGPQAAMWKAVPGKETEIFCPSLESGMNPDEQVDLIRNGLIRSVTVKEAQSTFPCPLGVPPDLYAFHCYTRNSTPLCRFDSNSVSFIGPYFFSA